MYPGTQGKPKGKLRLLYEGFPIAFLAEAAGGLASDGTMHILDKNPQSFHERTPLFVGNQENVQALHKALNGEPLAR